MKKKSLIKVILNIILLLIPIGFIIYFLTSENGMINLIESATTFSWQWIIFGVICHLSNIAADAFALYTLTKNYSKKYGNKFNFFGFMILFPSDKKARAVKVSKFCVKKLVS